MDIFRKILEKITGKPRYVVHVGVDFKWAKNSFIYNFFRLYEIIFGRRFGIRKESSIDQNGKVTFYTWEATFAYTEARIRAFSLLKFVEWVTQHRREKITLHKSFEWSPLLVYNLFRVYELVFGRRSGVRPEMSSMPDGQGGSIQAFHSWEAVLVHLELSFRALFTFKIRLPYKVWIPILKTPQGMPVFASPYLFAVGFNAVANSTESNVNTKTWSHNCTGSNMILTAAAVIENSTTDTFTAFTYNSVNMTAGIGRASSIRFLKIYYLTHPNIGSNTISYTFSGATGNTQGCSTSYSGASQVTIDNTGSGSGTGTTASASVTPVATNCWVVAAAQGDASVWNTATGATLRVTSLSAPMSIGDSNGTVTAATPYTISWTTGASSNWSVVIMSIAPSDVTITPLGSGVGGVTNSSTSSSASITIPTGTDLFIVNAYTIGLNANSPAAPSACTVGGVSATAVVQVPSGDQNSGWVKMFYLLSPPTGTQTVVVSGATGTPLTTGFDWSAYSGARQSAQPDSSGLLNNAATTAAAFTTTTVTVNSWAIVAFTNSGVTPSSYINGTQRVYSLPNNGLGIADSNGVLPSGSFTLTVNQSNSGTNGVIATFAPAGASPSPITPSVTDSSAVSDTPKVEIVDLFTVTDSTAVSDLPTIEIIDFVSVTDSTAVSDAPTIRIFSSVSLTDSTAVSDAPSIFLRSNINVSDSTAVSDVAAISVSTSVVVSDSTVVSETTSIMVVDKLSAIDSTSVTDTPTIVVIAAPPITISVQDTTSMADVVFMEDFEFFILGETTAVSDTPTIFIPILTLSVSDSSIVSDVLIIEEIYFINVNDSTAVSATPSLQMVSNMLVTDSTAISDTPTMLLKLTVNASDSTAVSDSPLILLKLTISVTDSIIVSDSDTIFPGLIISVSDSTTVTDAPSFEEEISFIKVTDTTTVTDFVVDIEFPLVVLAQDTITMRDVARMGRAPTVIFHNVQLGYQFAPYTVELGYQLAPYTIPIES